MYRLLTCLILAFLFAFSPLSYADSSVELPAATELIEPAPDVFIPQIQTMDTLHIDESMRYVDGIIFGLIIGLAIYNLALYFYLRDKSYLLFGLYGIFSALYVANITGYTLELLWPNSPYLNSVFSWFTLAALLACYTRFTRMYLSLDVYNRKGSLLLRVLFFAFWVVPFIGIIEHPNDYFRNLGYILNAVLSVTLFTMAMVLAILMFKKSKHLSISYLVANAVFCVFGTCYALRFFQLIPGYLVVNYAVQMGIVMQQILFSVGIAQRVIELRKAIAFKELEQERFERELVETKNQELEIKVGERTSELREEKEEVERLLHNILPREIVKELQDRGSIEPRRHEDTTILFTDFKGFTNTVATIPAPKLVQELNQLFRSFDDIIEHFGLEKLKTIGDAYMIAGGLPKAKPNHAVACVMAAMRMLAFIEERNLHSGIKWGMRVGIHSGSVVAGVVGKRKFTYDVWGDSVNIAARMEQSSTAGRINISAYTYDLIKDYFTCTYRGKVEVKGKGEMDMYYVDEQTVSDEEIFASVAADQAADASAD